MRLQLHAGNRGYGDAVRSGIRAARMDWVLLTDADLQFDLGELEDFLPSARRADLVIGWRILRQDPINRRLNAAAWNWLVRSMFHLPVRDGRLRVQARATRPAHLVRPAGERGHDLHRAARQVPLRGARGSRSSASTHRARVAGEQSGASPRVVLRAFTELSRLRSSLRATSTPGFGV